MAGARDLKIEDIYNGDDPEAIRMAGLIREQAILEEDTHALVGDPTNQEILESYEIPESKHMAIALAVKATKKAEMMASMEIVEIVAQDPNNVGLLDKIHESALLATFMLGMRFASNNE